jgi:predicted alpha/beta superfamily hydrolase
MSKPVFKDYAGNKALASGRMVTFRTEMKPYEDHRMRTIRVLLPKDYDGTKRFPVLYLHDGQNLFAGHDRMQKWYVDRAMKTLSKEGLSIIIVGIDTAATRFSELSFCCQ